MWGSEIVGSALFVEIRRFLGPGTLALNRINHAVSETLTATPNAGFQVPNPHLRDPQPVECLGLG